MTWRVTPANLGGVPHISQRLDPAALRRDPTLRSRAYAAQVAVSEARLDFDFEQPFVGHLPGYLTIGEAAGTDQPSWDEGTAPALVDPGGGWVRLLVRPG
jgi:hypothetical protein